MASNLGTVFVELSLDDKVYKQKLSDIQPHAVATAKGVETAWKALGTKSAEVFDAQRRAAENAYTLIKNSATRTSNDIIRAEEAKNAKIKQLNEQQYGHQTTMLEGLKKNWIAASVAIGAAMVAASKAMAYMEEGAKALQIESSFKIMSDAAGVHSEKLIASMKAATKETIDDSDMMQKAIKLMTLGYNPEQIERFSRVVITASQIAGTTAAEAYDGLADAIANRMPKALVRMGAVTKEQMKIVNKAIEEGADSTKLYELAMANLEMKQLMLQGTQDGATIAMQRFHAQIKETKEELGKGLIILVEKLYGVLQAVAAASLAASGGLFTLVSHLPGTDKAKWQGEAKAAFGAGESLAFKSNDNLFGATTKESKASSDALKAAQDRINALMKEMNAIIGKGDASKKAASEQEAATKKILEATRKAQFEIDTMQMSQFDKDIARIKAEEQQYKDSGRNKVLIAKWVATEIALADAKNTEEMFKSWRGAAEQAASDMMKEIDAGVKQTQDSLKKIADYDKMMGDEKAFTLDPHQDAINRVLEAEREKFAVIEDMRNNDLISFDEYEKSKALIAQNSAEEIAEINADLYQRQLNDVSAGFGNLSNAFEGISKMYAEGSEDAKRWQEAADAMLIAQKAVAVVQAVVAIATQGSGDPYTAFARIAAMAAAMGALLATIGESVGGGTVAASPKYNYGGSAGPLGAEEGTASESLSNTLKLLEETYDLEDTKLTKIYDELRNLNNSIIGLVTSIFKTGGINLGDTSLPTGTKYPGWWDMGWAEDHLDGILQDIGSFFEDIGGYILNGLFGGETEVKLKTGGIEFADILVNDIMDGMSVSARKFARYKITEDGGWFGSDKTSYKTKYAALDEDVIRMFTKVFDNLGGSLIELAKGLGTDVQAVYDYVFETTQLNLKGMDADEMSKALSEYFSKIADTAASDLFGTIISQYQQVNEALFETAVRLVTDKETVMNVLSATGHGMEQITTSVTKTRQAISDEWTKWEADRLKWSSSFIGKITTAFGGSYGVAEPEKYYTQTYNEITSNAQALIELSESLIELAGGLDKLTESAESYYTAFYSEAQQIAMLKGQLSGAFAELERAFPATRSGFRGVVEGLDLTTKAGRENYVAMLNMAESADKYYAYIEELASKRAEMEIDLLKLQGDAVGALAKERAGELEEMDASLRTFQSLIYAQEDFNDLLDKSTSLLEQWHSMESQLLELQGDKVGALAAKRADELDALDESLRPLQELLYAQEDLNNARAREITAVGNLITAQEGVVSELQGYVDKLKSARESMKMEGMAFAAQQATSARLAFNAVLGQARMGDLSGIGTVDNAMAKLIENANSPKAFQTKQQYEENYYRTYNDIAELEKLAGTQLSTEEQTLNTLKDQLKVLNQIAGNTDSSGLSVQEAQDAVNLAHAEVIAKQAALEQARAQYEATRQAFVTMEEVVNSINGNNSQLTMSIAEMTTALLEAKQAVVDATAGWATYQANQTAVDAAAEQARLDALSAKQAAEAQAAAQAQADALAAQQAAAEAKAAAEAAAQQAAAAEAQHRADDPLYDLRVRLREFFAPIARAFTDYGQVPEFAEGGTFAGGYRVVGENGPELEFTGPSQITSNSQSKALLDNSEVVKELKSLREDIKAYGYAIAKNTGKSAKVSDRWDIDGLPAERTIT